MKRTMSTVVLFVLLILTVVAITQIDSRGTNALTIDTSAVKHVGAN